MVFEQIEQPLRMSIMDDPAKVFCVSAVIPELLDVSTNLNYELFAQISMHYDIVRCDACLTGIHKSPESDLLCCEVNVRALVDYDRTLAT